MVYNNIYITKVYKYIPGINIYIYSNAPFPVYKPPEYIYNFLSQYLL